VESCPPCGENPPRSSNAYRTDDPPNVVVNQLESRGYKVVGPHTVKEELRGLHVDTEQYTNVTSYDTTCITTVTNKTKIWIYQVNRKDKLASVEKLQADVSSVSPSSETL